MRIRRFLLALSLVVCGASAVHGQDVVEEEFLGEEPGLPAEDLGAEQPIAIELAQGIDLLNTQIAQQEELLKTAQTEREQALIRNHLRLLQKERRSLESLLHKLVGPYLDVLEATREQRRELEYERTQRQLERDERSPSP